MTRFVETVENYIELEAGRIAPSGDAELLRAFGRGPRASFEEELLSTYPPAAPGDKKGAARVRASVQRQLQKWGLAGASKKKVTRGPLNKPGGFLQKKTRSRLRMILLRRRNADTRITIAGEVCYRSGDNEKCHRYNSKVQPVSERALLDILKLADVSEKSRSGVQPPAGGGERGEDAALNVLTGYWFPNSPQDIKCDGATVVTQRYDDRMHYTDTVFDIERISEGRSIAA